MESSSAAAIARLKGLHDSFLTCWDRLGLPHSATVLDVTKTYRRLSLLVHPDKAGPALVEEAHEAFQNLSVAFQQALKFAENRPAASSAHGADNSGGSREGAAQRGQGSQGSRGKLGGKEWWKHKKPWEIDAMVRDLERQYESEVAAGLERAALRRERRAKQQQKRHAEVAELQEEWLAGAEPVAEAKRSSWQAFVSGSKGPKRKRSGTV